MLGEEEDEEAEGKKKASERQSDFGLFCVVATDELSIASVGPDQRLVVPRLLDLAVLQHQNVIAELQILME